MPERPPLAPEAEVLLLCADRAQHVAEVIRPALAAGMVVLSDRFADSTLAYQGFGNGLDLASLDALTGYATGGLRPDLTILIDLDVEVGLARRRAAFRRGDGELNRIDRRDVAYHQRVRDGYLALAQREPERFFTVDGQQDPDQVADCVWQRVRDLLCLAPEPAAALP
jgi:dTMP kinase